MQRNANPDSSLLRVLVAMGVHVYTSLGLVLALLGAQFISGGHYRAAFLAMFFAVVVDATDGAMARAVDVKRHTPWVNGRKLDDLVDYLNYTFLPIYLICHAGWLPQPTLLWASIPLVCSALAFVHEGAKEEARGFFRGFPSYWNVVALYVALLFQENAQVYVAAVLSLLSVMSVLPIKFVYPNRPPCWRLFFLGGACLWGVLLLGMLAVYPDVPKWMTLVSLIYPAAYAASSIWLDKTR